MLKNEYRKTLLKSIKSHAQRFLKDKHAKNKLKEGFIKRSKKEISGWYMRFLQDRLNREIVNAYKLKKQRDIAIELKKLRLAKLANNNISEDDMVYIRRLASIPIKTLRQVAKLRNINENLSKSDITYALIRSAPVIDEEKYIIDSNNNIINKVNKVGLQLMEVSQYIDQERSKAIRKRLNEIRNTQNIDRKIRYRLLKELESIVIELKFIERHMVSDYGDGNYANIGDIEYIFGDIDYYYAPILANLSFDGGYQKYRVRGDKNCDMTIDQYYNTISTHLKMLIDINKVYETKIQIDMGFNMVHLDNNRRITHFSRSDNVICTPSSNTNDILNLVLTSFHVKMIDDIELSRESSNFVFESIEECNIHFYKIDLRRGSSFIEQPAGIKNKKATINPQNNDIYCFMYAVTIALYHKEFKKILDVLVKIYVCIEISFHGVILNFLQYMKTMKPLKHQIVMLY